MGGAGTDTLDGGAGFDMASYAAEATAVTVFLDAGDGTRSGAAAVGDVFQNVEGLIGGSADDSLVGDGNDNSLEGGGGDDTLLGGGGADTLDGGVGADSLDGGGGDADVASYADDTGGVTAYLDGRAGVGGEAQDDTLSGI